MTVFSKIRENTTHTIHKKLSKKFLWYKNWHKFKFSHHIHIATALVILFSVIVNIALYGMSPQRVLAAAGSLNQTTFTGSDGTYTSVAAINSNADIGLSGDGTGGTITHAGGNTIHTFTNVGNDTLTLTAGSTTYNYLIVAGGGAGSSGGGGGGGGVTSGSQTVGAGSTAILVGTGGIGTGGTARLNGSNGGNSSLGSIISYGGGGGAGQLLATGYAGNGSSGGSGGGGGASSLGSDWGSGGAATKGTGGGTSYGNTGGNSPNPGTCSPGGGGGGAGAGGAIGVVSPLAGGAGGAGLSYAISGSSLAYGGGGGGGFYCNGGTGGAGGSGVGGAGVQGGTPNNGMANRGGGGGGTGGNPSGVGGNGGSGVVIISYPTVYSTSGNYITNAVKPAGLYGNWGNITFDASSSKNGGPANTFLSVQVTDSSGTPISSANITAGANTGGAASNPNTTNDSNNNNLPGFWVSSGALGTINLTNISTTIYPSLKLKVSMTTSTVTNSPLFNDYTVNYLYDTVLVPQGLNFTNVGSGQVQVNWTAPSASNPASSATLAFNIQRAPDSAGVPGTWAAVSSGTCSTTVAAGSVSCTDTSVSPNTKYYYRLQSVDLNSNTSGWSGELSVDTNTTSLWHLNETSIPAAVSTYNYTGSDQTYTVPTGVTSITVKMWGGGGGGGSPGGWTYGYAGGGGGYTYGKIAVTPGQTLTVMVGAGGTNGATSNSSANYGGGGPTCGGTDCRYGGQGGGRSAIRVSSNDILTAGGGGGGGSTQTTSIDMSGGAGGGTIGLNGTAVGYLTGFGGGATQTAGGIGGVGNQQPGTSGSQYLGGRPQSPWSYGGSGGGGWYGGGAGSYSSYPAAIMGGGGGGSSYITGTGVSNGSTIAGSGTIQGNSTDADNGGKGAGGAASVNGQNGKIVIYPGDTIDSTSSSNHGTSSGTTVASSGKFSYSRTFNGTSDYIAVPTLSFGTSWTMEAWVKRNAGAGIKTVLDFNDNSNICYIRIGDVTANVASLSCSGGMAIVGSVNVSDGNWHHIVGVRNGASDARLYVDGAPDGTPDTTYTTASFSSSYGSRIGNEYWAGANYYSFDGQIDEAKVSNVARSASVISAEYAESNPQPKSVTTSSITVPTGLTLSNITGSQIQLNWTDLTQPPTSMTDLAGYEVQRATDSGGFPGTFNNVASGSCYGTNQLVTTNSCTDTTVSGNTKYWYRLRTKNNNGSYSTYSLSSPYLYSKDITFNTTGTGASVTTPQTNFPIEVHINSSSWPTLGDRNNFFGASNVNGKRVRFYDSDQTTNLPYEVEYYNQGGQEAVYWVQVPQVDGNSNTDKITVYYGNDPYGSAQDSAVAVWSNGYKGVWHLGDNAIVTNALDSTGVANDAMALNTATQGTGYVRNGVVTSGTTNNLNSIAVDNTLSFAGASISVSSWVKTTASAGAILNRGNPNSPWQGFNFTVGGCCFNDGKTAFWYGGGAYAESNSTVNDDGWHHIAVSYNDANASFFKDGSLDGSPAKSGTTALAYPGVSTGIGGLNSESAYGQKLNGTLDEIRISNVARTADWQKLEYFSMKVNGGYNGGSFATDGSQASVALTSAATLTNPPATASAAAVSTSEIDPSWTAPSSGTVTYYHVYRDGVQKGGDIPASTFSYADTGIAGDNTSHTYYICGTNAGGVDTFSGTKSSCISTSRYTLALAPTLNSYTSPTKNNRPAIAGSTSANAFIRLYDNGTTLITNDLTQANGSGNFTVVQGNYTGVLSDATHSITAKSINGSGDVNATASSPAMPLVVDTIAPTVTNITSNTANGYYKAGAVLDARVTFSETVNVTGYPQLTLATGGSGHQASYVSGSGSNTLVFTYTVQAGDNSADLDYHDTTSLSANGGTIQDAALNDTTLTLPAPGTSGSLGANKNIIVDTIAPTVTNITSNTANGSYKAGAVLDVRVTFSETVNVTGSPQLTLATGGSGHQASFVSGSGSNTLVFTYTVQAGDTSADLDYHDTGSFSANGGTIQDAALNDVTLTLASPGAAGSLGANKNIVLDTTAPTLSPVSVSSSNTDHTKAKPGDTVTLSFTSSEPLAASPTVTINNHATIVSNSNPNFSVSYVMASSDAEGVVTFNISNFTDFASNAGTAVTSTTDSSSVVFDKTLPTLSLVSISSSNSNNALAKSGDTVTLTFHSSETINTPLVSIAGHSTSPSGSSPNFTASYQMVPGDIEGPVSFNISSFSDQSGNAGVTVTSTTDSSIVTFDKTAPAGTISVFGQYTTSNIVMLTINATDVTSGVSQMQLSNDGSIFCSWIPYATSIPSGWDLTTNCGGPIPYTNEGSRTVYINFYDNAGNISTASDTVVFDTQAPTNTTSVEGYSSVSQVTSDVTSSTWVNHTSPKFVWDGASDASPGSGIKDYSVYFGTDQNADPTTATDSSNLAYTDNGNSNHFVGKNYTVSSVLESGKTYYLKVMLEDNAGWTSPSSFSEGANEFIYKFDNTPPANVSYITANPAGWATSDPFSFSWPSSSDPQSNGNASGILKYQYRVDDGADTWHDNGTNLTKSGINHYTSGANTFQVRVIDNAGNASTDNSHAPTSQPFYFSGSVGAPQNLQVDQSQSQGGTINKFKFTWDPPAGVTTSGYYYSVNSDPSPSNSTFTANPYTDFYSAATQPDINHFYVVAKDNLGNIDWAHYASAPFSVNTFAPSSPAGITITDASNRNTNLWALTVTWTPILNPTPDFSGYEIWRCTANCGNDANFNDKRATVSTNIYSEAGLDNVTDYYYKIKSRDTVGNTSSFSTVVHKIPTGKYVTPPSYTSDPKTTVKAMSATIDWTTNRASNTIVQYGTTTSYGQEASKSTEALTDHSIDIAGLAPCTTYHFRVQSLDANRDYDPSAAYSQDFTFTTLDAPGISQVSISDIGLYSAIVTWKTSSASTSTLKYGSGTSYGKDITDISGSSVTNHTVKIDGLSDSSMYHFKIFGTDVDGNAMQSDDYSFQTLTFPRVFNLHLLNVSDAVSNTVKLNWESNVPLSSTVQYRESNGGTIKEISASKLDTKHELTVSGLKDDTSYTFVVQGRDAYGNEATSDETKYLTAFDTRPPGVSGVNVESNIIGTGLEARIQVVLSWQTDELSTSQVEYAVGITGDTYNLKSQEDTTMTMTHVVVISDLKPATTYHFKVMSKDEAGNSGYSDDSYFLTQQASQSVLGLILDSIQKAFGWLFNF